MILRSINAYRMKLKILYKRMVLKSISSGSDTGIGIFIIGTTFRIR